MKFITKPTLLIDKQKVLLNIKLMADKAKKNNVKLRPHLKTHQLPEVGEWFRGPIVDAFPRLFKPRPTPGGQTYTLDKTGLREIKNRGQGADLYVGER